MRVRGASCNANGGRDPLPTRVSEKSGSLYICGQTAVLGQGQHVVGGLAFTDQDPTIMQNPFAGKGFALF